MILQSVAAGLTDHREESGYSINIYESHQCFSHQCFSHQSFSYQCFSTSIFLTSMFLTSMPMFLTSMFLNINVSQHQMFIIKLYATLLSILLLLNIAALLQCKRIATIITHNKYFLFRAIYIYVRNTAWLNFPMFRGEISEQNNFYESARRYK